MTDLTALLQQHVDSGTVPGAVALVVSGDDVELATAGVRGADGAAMSRDTIFRIASISKPIMAAATMTLVEDGTLGLDDAVSRWLPEIAAPMVMRTPASPVDDVVPVRRPITVRDLLTFLSGWGFPSDFSLPAVGMLFSELHQGPEWMQAPAPDEWMRRLAAIPLLHQPGETWLYNTGSDLLSVLVSRAVGQPLQDVLTERIFGPLGMQDTAFWVPPDKLDRFTDFTRGGPDGTTFVDPPAGEWSVPPAFPSGSGGMVCTVDDWAAFAAMLLADGGSVLSAESVRLMTTDQLTATQRADSTLFLEGQGWGFGGSVDVDPIDVWNVPGRYGWVGGSGTAAHIVPAQQKLTILLTQVEMTSPVPPAIMREFWAYAATR